MCKENEIVDVSLSEMTWTCSNDTGKCPDGPGLGGFHFGCERETDNGNGDNAARRNRDPTLLVLTGLAAVIIISLL